MRLAYCSGPYRDKNLRGVIANIREAERVAIELWRLGYAVICPHTNTALMDGMFEEGSMSFENSTRLIEGDLEILNRFDPYKDIVVMLKDWQKSEGAKIERRHALSLDILVLEWDDASDRKWMMDFANETDI